MKLSIAPTKNLKFFIKCRDLPYAFDCNLGGFFLGHFPPHYTSKTPNSTQTFPHSQNPNFTLKGKEAPNLHWRPNSNLSSFPPTQDSSNLLLHFTLRYVGFIHGYLSPMEPKCFQISKCKFMIYAWSFSPSFEMMILLII